VADEILGLENQQEGGARLGRNPPISAWEEVTSARVTRSRTFST
jgi:hypothetical protein